MADDRAPATAGLPDKSRLLGSLRLDHGEREAVDGHALPWRWIILGVAGLLVAAAAGAWWLRPGALAVRVATASAPQAAADGAVLQATGYVTARRQATVSAQITGTVTRVLFDEGDHVAAGQVMAQLDATQLDAQLAQAQAQQRSAEANLAQAQAQQAQAARDLVRQQELMARQLTSRQALESAQTVAASAEAAAGAQRQLIEVARATVRSAQVQASYATVRAPFAGVVIARSAQVGEIVSPFSAGGGFTRSGIGTLVDMDSLEVQVDVGESYLHRISPGQPAQAVLDAYPDWLIPARVKAIIPTADRGKATVKVRVALEAHDGRILPDMGARVSFLENGRGPAPAPLPGVRIPAEALAQRDGHAVAWVVEAGRVRAAPIELLGESGSARRVRGLDAGAQVVLGPPAGLADGARVTVVDTAAAPR